MSAMSELALNIREEVVPTLLRDYMSEAVCMNSIDAFMTAMDCESPLLKTRSLETAKDVLDAVLILRVYKTDDEKAGLLIPYELVETGVRLPKHIMERLKHKRMLHRSEEVTRDVRERVRPFFH